MSGRTSMNRAGVAQGFGTRGDPQWMEQQIVLGEYQVRPACET